MLRKVMLKKKRMEDYVKIVGEDKADKINQIARSIRGIRVLHINTTASGGGVAELLNSSIPLLNSLGLNVNWALLYKEEPFFEVTKNIHNALQGKHYLLSDESKSIYLGRIRWEWPRSTGLQEKKYPLFSWSSSVPWLKMILRDG